MTLRLSLDALAVLDAIDREGSFAAAAESLHRVPSAITYVVQKLEQDLEVQLFDRSGHRAKLTTAGQELLEQGRSLLRAAGDLEARVKRVATGWETELCIAVDTLFDVSLLFPLIEEFYAAGGGTRVKLSHEVLGGCWDALLSRRADLVIGAPGSAPGSSGFATRYLGDVQFVFCVAPGHPLAAAPEPLKASDILWHRAIAVSDTSRNLAPHTAGLLLGQETLAVPDMRTKLAAQIAGLGCGGLPRFMAEPALKAGLLVEKQMAEPRSPVPFYLAWRMQDVGNALQWWLTRLDDPVWLGRLFSST